MKLLTVRQLKKELRSRGVETEESDRDTLRSLLASLMSLESPCTGNVAHDDSEGIQRSFFATQGEWSDTEEETEEAEEEEPSQVPAEISEYEKKSCLLYTSPSPRDS